MPESTADTESTPSPYISPQEDEDNAGRLKPDVAHQVYNDIRQEAEREAITNDLDVKNLFDERSKSTLPDYQAAQIVDVEDKAITDPLTGLLNRRGFERKVAERLAAGAAGLAIMIDADHFKTKVNDVYGHQIGDEVLKYIALGLRANTDVVKDIVGRYGGEEFVVFLEIANPNLQADKIYEIAERIRHDIVEYLKKARYQTSSNKNAEETLIPVTLSLGATITCGEPWEKALKRADENLYKAKDGGRKQSIGDNGKIIFTPTPPPDGQPETASN